MWWRSVLLLCILVISPSLGGIFDFSEFDDPFSTLSNINRNTVWWRNTYGTTCNVTYKGDTNYGVCKPSLECRTTGGEVLGRGTCNFQQCCVYAGFCESVTSKKVSYFNSPTKDYPTDCTFTVKVNSLHVCQMRIDFEEFELSGPSQDSPTSTKAWSCRTDSFKIETPNDFKPPELCGYNTDQHMYIPVNASNNEQSIKLKISLADRSNINQNPIDPTLRVNPKWKIRITQLECPAYHKQLSTTQLNIYRDFSHLAPPGCLQYYTERVGTVRNFGYNPGLPVTSNHYTGGLDYGICFRRTPSTCGMRFTGLEFQLSTCPALPTDPAGDYLLIPDGKYTTVAVGAPSVSVSRDRYCDNELGEANPGAVAEAVTQAPLYIHFVTDTVATTTMENGFLLRYEVPPANNCN